MFAYLQSAARDVTSFFTSVWRYFVGRPAQASENLSESLLHQDTTPSPQDRAQNKVHIERDTRVPAEEKKPLSQTTPLRLALRLALRPAPVEEQKTLKPLRLLDYSDHRLFKVKVLENMIFEYSNPAGELLTAVAHAAPEEKDNPDLSKTVAERFVKQAPYLLAHKGYVEDLAGNTFQKVTTLQYVVWAGDWHMYNMLLKYMDKTTAKAQLEELLTKGVEYTDAKGEQHKEQLFSLQPLLNAYAHLEQAIEEGNGDLADKIWVEEIGAAQAVVPACVAQQFCHPTRHFGKGKDTDFSGLLPRSLETEGGFWYPATEGDWTLGITHAYVRGHWTAPLQESPATGRDDPYSDLPSVQSLSDKRTEQVNTLAASLGVKMSQESSSSPRPK